MRLFGKYWMTHLQFKLYRAGHLFASYLKLKWEIMFKINVFFIVETERSF